MTSACLIDAAFAQECLDGNGDDNLTAMRPAAWQDYFEALRAAHWHEQFDSSDSRSTLTWRGRFAGAISKVYNFYSSTEDVLGEYDGEVPTTSLGALGVVILNDASLYSYVWVYQEKSKGNRQDYYLPVPGSFHAGSRYGGWGFNLNDSLLNGDPDWYAPYISGGTVIGRRVKTPDEIGTVDGALLTQTRWTPLFKTGWGRWDSSNPTNVVVDTSPAYYTGPSWIFDLYARDTTGSDVAADPANRAQLLAEAIPALSLPVGANETSQLNDRNFNMPALFADETHWPSSRGAYNHIPKWWHSDIAQVSYPYLYKFYNQLVSISNQ